MGIVFATNYKFRRISATELACVRLPLQNERESVCVCKVSAWGYSNFKTVVS